MPYTLIKGQFIIHYPDMPRNGPEPDGDTVKFQPADQALVNALARPGHGPDFNRQGMVSVRFEAIDALETHFQEMHQQLEFALRARDRMLEILGFGQVQYFDEPGVQFKVRQVEQHPRPGYLLARTLDQHGRIVGFVCEGDSNEPDGAQVMLRSDRVVQSLNARLIAEGLAYASFYDTLPADLRGDLKQLAVSARQQARGLYPLATATPERWARVDSLRTLETLVLFPKLFRRLASYFSAGNTGLSGFLSWLRADPVDRDDRLLLPTPEIGNLHDILEVRGNEIRMTLEPEEFVILDGSGPAPELPKPTVEASAVRVIAALVNPIGAEVGFETVTLLNATAATINLDSFSIRDRAGGSLKLSGQLGAGDALRVKLNAAVRLANTGDEIRLFSGERLIDQVAYGPNEGRLAGVSVVF
jgi:endonuclease YncB( thermonuclease family)